LKETGSPPLCSELQVCGTEEWRQHFGATALIFAEAPAVLPTVAFAP